MKNYNALSYKIRSSNIIYKYLFLFTLFIVLFISLLLIHLNLLLLPVKFLNVLLLFFIVIYLIFSALKDIAYFNNDRKVQKDCRTLVLAGLQIVKNDMTKLSKMLDVNIELLEAIITKNVVLKRKDISKIRRNFSKRIALVDFADYLEPKDHFRTKFKNLADVASLSVAFIDINSLKPIQEQYGEDARDEILQLILENIKQLYPGAYIVKYKISKICVIFPNKNKYQAGQLKQDLENVVSKPYCLDLTGITAAVSAVVQFKSYPDDIADINNVLDYLEDHLYGD